MHPSTALPTRLPRTSRPRSVWVVIGLIGATIGALAAAIVWRGPDSAPQEPTPAVATGAKPLPVAGPAVVQHGAPARRGAPTNGAAPAPRLAVPLAGPSATAWAPAAARPR